MGKKNVIVVANQKGGVGKTTVSIALTQELRRRGYKTLMVDLCSQRNTSDFYDAKIKNQPTMMDLLCDDYPVRDCIQHLEYGDIIAADPDLKEVSTMVADDEYRFLHLKMALEEVKDEYDFIFIDTPPEISLLVKNGLNAADYVLIVIEPGGCSITGIIDLYQDGINKTKKIVNRNIKVLGFLRNIWPTRETRRSRQTYQEAVEVAEALGTKVFETKIRRSTGLQDALTGDYIPLFEHAETKQRKSGTTVDTDFRYLADELIKQMKECEN